MKQIAFLICSVLACSSILAEEDDFDLEFEFGLKKKSTIRDFPLQELDSEVLSDAAIAGALQASSAGSGSGKPAYLEQKEKDEKQSKSELKLDPDYAADNEALRYGQPTPQFIQFELPVYQMDTGRINQHNNTAFERP